MQCECARNCTCEVEQQKNLERNGKYYCAEACANGPQEGKAAATKAAIAKGMAPNQQ